jgi:hypothetical protein
MVRVGIVSLVFLVSCGFPSKNSTQSTTKKFENYQEGEGDFPLHPDPNMTPGSTCQDPDETRYPEKIGYCRRSVSKGVKRSIIETYDETFGYHVGDMNRQDFKIDHLIALCMGGSNEVDNLWPQHKSTYVLTDPLEEKLCVLMQRGKILQAEAIETIIYAKYHLEETGEIKNRLDAMLHQ